MRSTGSSAFRSPRRATTSSEAWRICRSIACASDAAPALYRRPGHPKGARILDKDRNVNRHAIGREPPALHHVELVGMRRAVVIDEGLGRNANGVDDQRVAVLVVADGFTVPGGLHILLLS